MISQTTIRLCLELISNISVPVVTPDAEIKIGQLASAHRELSDALADE